MSTRVALVTGASSGIGEQTALRLQEAGFVVYAVARRVERMQTLADAGIHVFAMDVTVDASMTGGVARIIHEQGRIDVLVNNAGYGSYGAVEEVPIEEARQQFEVNVFGLARLTQLVLPHMREIAREPLAQRPRIVNISSVGGKFYEPLGAWYHATKFAVEGFSDSLRIELEPHGIDVVIIEPGLIRTEWNEIARAGLLDVSRDGPYDEQAHRVHHVMARADRRFVGSGPDVVAKRIVAAIQANTPRARYPVGRGARTLVLARRLLPDAVFDYVVKGAYGVRGRSGRRRPGRTP
ncbi:oxidoreductase [Nocardioides sp.]|uniref:oxidoreductase n=1 Tax=Nocardioides sp. TaxID=35761 RepID=UPI002ED5D07E